MSDVGRVISYEASVGHANSGSVRYRGMEDIVKQIRLVQIGNSDTALISNLASTLNSLQAEFRFGFDPTDAIPLRNATKPSTRVDSDQIESLLQRHMDRRSIRDYSVGICARAFTDQIVTSSDDRKAVISTKGWEVDSSRYPILQVVTFGLIDILFESLGIATPTHYEAAACPMDYMLADKNVFSAGIKTADLCPECRSLILRQVSNGRVTLQQVAAIYKLLDFVAGRKACFVLMPFARKFDAVYECIQPTMTGLSWSCTRADEIHQPREIIDQIWENILRADLVIADLTGTNPNVFYELGYAHALNKNTILLTQSIDDVPFDLRHRRLVCYSGTSAGYRRLRSALRKYVL
jgi:hypothetical protein